MSSRYSYIHLLLPLLLILGVTQLVNYSLAQAETNSFDCTSVTQIPQSECEALVALYNSTDGDNWLVNSGWLETNTPCSWYRVTCISGYVTEVRLWDNQLSGMIPPELSNLTNLQALHLGGNQLSGAVPPELGNLTNLQFLHLSVNQLSGAIPPELGNLTNLGGLYLSANQLSGAIPPELGNLTNLGGLYLLGNQLSGTVPPELGNLTNLQALHLSSNQLSGAIPPELGNLTNLQWLHLSNNQLSGEVPLELANPANLGVLDLQGNQLSGAVPPELGNLTNLQRLDLSSNQLSGPIPLELTNLTNLQSLRLEGNQLSGAIPSELGSLTNLQRLHLSNNQLNEEIPPELGNLTNLQWLRLEDNQLSGEIPMSFVNLTNLYSFWFAQTNLCEPPDPTFQAWLSSVPDVRSPGVLCDPTIPPECHAANAARQPLLLVTGWSGSKPSASQDDQLKFFFGANGHLAPYGYVEGCNLFYAEATSPYRWLDDNGHVIRDNLCLAYTQVKAFNPGWNGRFEIIAFSYGGLRARAYLENSDLYGEKCPGTQNRVYVDNLFTMGTPHGGEPYPLLRSLLPFAGIIGLCAVANVPLFCEEGGGQWPALAEMHPATRLAQNLSSSQATGVCYRLLSGDARQQSPQFPRRLIALTAPFPSTYLTANDLAVHRNSAYILNKFPYSLLYSRTVPIDTPDLHGHAPEDVIGQHTLRSYVNPNTTFDQKIWPILDERRNCSPASQIVEASNSGPTITELLAQQSEQQTTIGIPMMDIAAGSLTDDETTSGSFSLSGAGSSQIMLSWLKNDLVLSLVDPDGTLINPTTAQANPNVDYLSLDTGFGLMSTYLFTNTVNGVWQYTITGTQVVPATAYRLIALPPTPIAVSPSLPQWLPNNTPVVITATVAYSQTTPVIGGTVKAQINRPDGTLETISLYDDGAHQDGQVNDGVFGGVYTQTVTGGIYGLLVTATGIHDSEIYTRTATAYFTVAPAGAALGDAYSDSGIDDTGNGIYDWLEVTAQIDVTEATTYTLSAELYAGETFITHARQRAYLATGSQSLDMLFSGPAIFERGLDGPYTIRNVMLLEEAPLTLLIEAADNVHVTQAYRYTDFGQHMLYLPAILH